MADTPDLTLPTLRPGDVLAVDTPSGPAHVQITHVRAPYPDVIRAIRPIRSTDRLEDVAAAPTAFVTMVELAQANADQEGRFRRVGNAPIPAENQTYPRFRIAIRNRAGETVYWWSWDGEGLSFTTVEDATLPEREVLSVDRLIDRLAAVGQ